MPLTLRITFEAESKIIPPPLTLRRVWTAESESHQRPKTIAESKKIRKPPGEVGRPSRGGYRLTEALGLSDREYQEIQV